MSRWGRWLFKTAHLDSSITMMRATCLLWLLSLFNKLSDRRYVFAFSLNQKSALSDVNRDFAMWIKMHFLKRIVCIRRNTQEAGNSAGCRSLLNRGCSRKAYVFELDIERTGSESELVTKLLYTVTSWQRLSETTCSIFLKILWSRQTQRL